MERAKDRSSTPGHPEAGGQEGSRTIRAGRRRYREPVTPSLRRPCSRRLPRRSAGSLAVRYVREKAIMAGKPRSPDAATNGGTSSGGRYGRNPMDRPELDDGAISLLMASTIRRMCSSYRCSMSSRRWLSSTFEDRSWRSPARTPA